MRYRTLAPMLFLAGATAGIPAGFVFSQVLPQMRVDVLLQQVVRDIPQPANVHVHDDRWDPGAETGAHDHPGPAILAIIEGELVEETPGGRNILRAGNAVWRPAKQTHNVKNVSDQPARVLAIHFDPVRCIPLRSELCPRRLGRATQRTGLGRSSVQHRRLNYRSVSCAMLRLLSKQFLKILDARAIARRRRN
jgi:quercetin dioxygenase-like cupin family protein